MKTILQLNASIHSDASASSRLSDELVETLVAGDGETRIIRRDLARQPVAHLDADTFKSVTTPADQRDARQQDLAAQSEALIDELQQADILILGLPMYNFGMPSTLKAWFDHIARAGQTFKYTANGPVGLLAGKKAYVLATRGGRYAGTPDDLQTEYLRKLLAFLGITDVEFVYAEGLSMGDEQRQRSLANARVTLQNLVAPARLAA